MALSREHTDALLSEQSDIEHELRRVDDEIGELTKQQRRRRERLRHIKVLLGDPKSVADVIADSGGILHGGVSDEPL